MTHESNGIDIITALILNDISPLCSYRMEMVLQLKVRCPARWAFRRRRMSFSWSICQEYDVIISVIRKILGETDDVFS